MTGIEPATVNSHHLAWLTIRGEGFAQRQKVQSPGSDPEVLETVFISKKELRALVRFGGSAEEKEVGLVLADKSGDTEFKVTLLPEPAPDMALAPAGFFLYGSDEGSEQERPQRTLFLPAFAIDIYEVRVLDYLEFLNYMQQHGDHSRCHPHEGHRKSHIPDNWDDPDRFDAHKPVTGIDWYDAFAYASWRGLRLPTEEEWEKAARGADGAPYPWGGEPDISRLNTAASTKGLDRVYANPTGRSPYGLFNAAGNVWEWTAGAGPQPGQAVLRGGSCSTDLLGSRCFVRNWLDREARRADIGFRCAGDIK